MEELGFKLGLRIVRVRFGYMREKYFKKETV